MGCSKGGGGVAGSAIFFPGSAKEDPSFLGGETSFITATPDPGLSDKGELGDTLSLNLEKGRGQLSLLGIPSCKKAVGQGKRERVCPLMVGVWRPCRKRPFRFL